MSVTRLLAVSDIHGDIAAVKQLRAAAPGPFDVVVVAGDITAAPGQWNPRSGDLQRWHTAETARADMREMLAILVSYGCPVCFVLGNHDSHIGYEADAGLGTHHLQDGPLVLDRILLSGFSGCDGQWDGNPFWLARYGKNDAPTRCERTLEDNRQKVAAEVAQNAALQRSRLVVTHDRLTGTRSRFQAGTVFVNGHAHGASLNSPRASYRIINPGSLFREWAVVPVGEPPRRGWKDADRRRVRMGGYAVLEIAPSGLVSAEHRRMAFDRSKWREAENDHAPVWLSDLDLRTEHNPDVDF